MVNTQDDMGEKYSTHQLFSSGKAIFKCEVYSMIVRIVSDHEGGEVDKWEVALKTWNLGYWKWVWPGRGKEELHSVYIYVIGQICVLFSINVLESFTRLR